MEVNPNRRATDVARTVDATPLNPAPKAQASAAMFGDSDAVDRALQQTPEVRSDKVAQATELANNIQYPPIPTIRAISHLLALHFDRDHE